MLKLIYKFLLLFFVCLIFGNLNLYANSFLNTSPIFPVVSNNETTYTLYYGNGCPHCAKVEEFIKEKGLDKKYKIEFKEVYQNKTNREELFNYAKKLNIDFSNLGVPFLLIRSGTGYTYIEGDKDIIDYFQNKLSANKDNNQNSCGIVGESNSCVQDNQVEVNKNGISKISSNENTNGKIGDFEFLLIMLPAALCDSINPCAFAVMLILLASILQARKKRRDVILSGFLFILAVFISYYLMGLGILKALATLKTIRILKIIVGLLGIFVGLANLKDAFWYGKFFVMEVPFSWRPKLKKIICSVTSPIGAFFVGLVVSLFLLPCTSGPYLTILGFLTAEGIEYIKGLVYLFIYNMIFVLPMVAITFLVAYGESVEKLMKIKDKNNKYIHLIVGLIMLGLGIYVLIS